MSVHVDPQAQVLVLPASQARLSADAVSLPGAGTVDVFEDEDGDQLVQVTGGRVLPEELVRAVLRTPGFSVRDDVLDLVVVTDTGWDRYVLTRDLATRLLHARHDDQETADGGRHVLVVGPPVEEPLVAAAPSTAALAVAELVGRGSRAVGRLTELPLVDDPALARHGGRRDEALAEADVVVAAWGAVGPEFEVVVDDVREALRTYREQGGGVLVRTRAGLPDAIGADGDPTARGDVRPDDGLTSAPADWLWGAPLG